MNQQNASRLKWSLEIIWWIVTIILAIAVLLPIYFSVVNYPFWNVNIIYIVVFVTFTRYIFFLKHTFLANIEYLKVLLIFLCFPLIFYLIQELNTFQTFLDEEGAGAIVGNDDPNSGMINYVRSEFLLFGVGSVIASIVFPFRLILSVWRSRNSNKV